MVSGLEDDMNKRGQKIVGLKILNLYSSQSLYYFSVQLSISKRQRYGQQVVRAWKRDQKVQRERNVLTVHQQ